MAAKFLGRGVALLVVALGLAALFWTLPKKAPSPIAPSPSPASDSPPPLAHRPSPSPAAAGERIALADNLNAPSGTIDQDLRIVREIFTAWLTNFPREGNPVGENAEITAALTGKNSFSLALIPPGHRAINARGELVDRWGTPFRLHQLSGTRMEVRSAGPDRKFATEDDAMLMPP